MKIPIRIQQVSVTNEKYTFSILKGLKNFLRNIKKLFTQELLSNDTKKTWHEYSNTEMGITDMSLIYDAESKTFLFKDTPAGEKSVALEIKQNIKV